MSAAERVAQIRVTVRKEDTAESFGREFPAAASTPFVLGLAEIACHRAAAPLLGPGQISVGVRAQVDHLLLSPVGVELLVDARMTSRARRRLHFWVEVTESGRVVARLKHSRAITEPARVLERMKRP